MELERGRVMVVAASISPRQTLLYICFDPVLYTDAWAQHRQVDNRL